jgi:hypothetical protein
MKIENVQEGKIIILETPLDNREKWLKVIYLFTFLFAIISLFFLTINNEKGLSTVAEIILVAASGLFFFMAFRFINKACKAEKLIVTKNTLTLVRSGFLNKNSQVFETKNISNFCFNNLHSNATQNNAQYSSNLSFEPVQQYATITGPKLAFDYNGTLVTFGNQVFSWDFEKIRDILYEIIGSDYRD